MTAWYDATNNSITATNIKGDGTTNNTPFLRTLFAGAISAGGGTIYFPKGIYFASIHNVSGDRTSVPLVNKGSMKLRILGDGPMASVFTWGGDAVSQDAHLFEVADGSSDLFVENIGFRQKDAITNPDGAEQHHCFKLSTRANGNVQNIRFHNCHFGVFKGDGIMCGGSQKVAECHTGVAANAAAGAISGTFTSPAKPQRVFVEYAANWDGGSITISGTDPSGQTISETIAALSGIATDGYVGELYFATVTGATKSLTGASAAIATIGYAYEVRDVTIRDCVFDGFVFAGTSPGYGFRCCILAQRMSVNIRVLNCDMTGSSDQLIDFEPTGKGPAGPWIVDNCSLVAANPAAAPIVLPTVGFGGNGNASVAPKQLEDSLFTRNRVWGRLKGGKLLRCKITDNVFIADTNTSSTEPMIILSETDSEVEISRNLVVTRPGFAATRAIAVIVASNFRPVGVKINDNTVQWYSGTGLKIESPSNCEVVGNHMIYLGSATDTDIGIDCANNLVTVSSFVADRNHIEGDRGGGTLKHGVQFNPGTTIASSRVSLINNRGTGCVNGVRVPAPSGTSSFGTPPIIMGNDFQTATTPLFIGTGMVYVVAGNNGGWRFLRGSTADPNALSTLNGEELGSLYSGANGTVYRKATAGASGWTAI